MTEFDLTQRLEEVRRRTTRVVAVALVFNFVVVVPIFGYDVYLVRTHAPANISIVVAALGLIMWTAMYITLMRAMRKIEMPTCVYCKALLTWKDRTKILETKACPACNQHLFDG